MRAQNLHYAFDKYRRKRSLAKFKWVLQQRTWRRSGHVDVRKANKADARNVRDEAWVSTFSIPRRCVGKCSYKENAAENGTRSAHVCANARSSTLGTWHASGVELRSRVDGRYLPEQLRVRVHCRWGVTPLH